ncbi:MAG: DUF1501 domain-containing protein [Acidobacteriota bacterium]
MSHDDHGGGLSDRGFHDRGLPKRSLPKRGLSERGLSEHSASPQGCSEYRHLSRRRFLGVAGGAVGLAAVPAWLPRVSLAEETRVHAVSNGTRDVMVSIFLRGGADGLSLCVPHTDDAYYALRPTLAIARPDDAAVAAARRTIDLDGTFGLAPALAPLRGAFDDRALAIVHACGLDHPTRSHFDAMRFVEVGRGDAPLDAGAGWLSRHLATSVPMRPDAPLRAVAFGHALPRTLAGAPAAVPIPDAATYGPRGPAGTMAAWWREIASLYHWTDEPMRSSARRTADTVELLRTIDAEAYQPSSGVEYPDDDFGLALRSTAALLDADIGLEAASIDLGGWDTHDDQAPVDGAMADRMTVLAAGLAAFYRDLEARAAHRVTVVVHSEFGRNAFENGSRGTDHGHAGALFVLGIGGGVAGGRVVTEWPGLDQDQLYEGQDLHVTLDYRDVLGEALVKRLGRDDPSGVFDDPTYTWTDRGIFVPHA